MKLHEVAQSEGVTQMDQTDLAITGGLRAVLPWPQT